MDGGKLAIWYELIRPHKVIEAAFRDTLETVINGTGITPLLGTPE